ncbi:MAG: M28 family peptidase [Bacteroidales bacterium]|nr:M28 family peptidase [Bacteroidales bacterium]
MDIKYALKFITRTLPVMVFLIFLSCTSKQEVTVKELHDHIEYLSSDSLKGRLAGSSGDSLAAEYIKHELLSYGFIPLPGDGLQRFSVTSRLVAGKENIMTLDGANLIPEKDFMPFAFSSNSGLESEVIFIGYGFMIDEDSLKWNDYQGIDIKGKWVMMLRADPETDKPASPFIPFSGDRDKAMLAKDMGSAGVLLVSGAAFDPQDTFESLNSGDFSVDIPVLRIKREVADIILSKAKISVASLENKLNDTRKPSSFPTGTVVNARAEIKRELRNTRNVVMALPGEDEILKDEYIIIGAHFDHLGMGGTGSSSMAGDTVAVHHGADDNASGVGMMLELAEKFALTKGSHKRSIICIAFSGEELGLLGSKYFAENPGIDLTKVNAMINLDMVGRLPETNVLQISGVGTAEGLKELVVSENDTNLISLVFSDEGYGRSDHTSFYGKNIPVLFYFTGAHLDYHKPADTYDKINYDGMVTISSLIFNVTEKLASSPERLQFREAGPKPETIRSIRKKIVTLGIMPDFAGIVKNGMRADEVYPGRPAALGGMKKGDIITGINGKIINNIQDYMFRLGQIKYGQIITVEVLRNNKKIVLLIQI